MQRRTFLGSLIALATLGKIPKARAGWTRDPKTLTLSGSGVINFEVEHHWEFIPRSEVAEDYMRIQDAEILENYHLPGGYRSELVELMIKRREQVMDEYFEACHKWIDENIPLMPSDAPAIQRLLTSAGA